MRLLAVLPTAMPRQERPAQPSEHVRACVRVCVRVRVGVRARAVRLRARVYDQACEQHVHGFTDKSMAR